MSSSADPREDLLARIDPVQQQITDHKAGLEACYLQRADVFLEISEADPDLSVKAIAARAGVTGPAVSQQIQKAREARAERLKNEPPPPEPPPIDPATIPVPHLYLGDTLADRSRLLHTEAEPPPGYVPATPAALEAAGIAFEILEPAP